MTRRTVRSASKAVTAALRRAATPKRPKSALRKPAQSALQPARPTTSAGWRLGALGTRRYRLYKPPSASSGTRLPLLVMLHGCAQDAQTLASVSQMNRVAAREGFFVLYPQQDRISSAQACWNWFATATGQAQREAESITGMIDQACRTERIDPGKLAIAGFSAGACMAALLAARHPDRFRAIAMHSGVAPGAAQSQVTAVRAMRGRGPGPKPLPALAPGAHLPALLVIHGNADGVVAPRNGLDAAALWAACEGAAAGAARTVQRGNRYATTITDYKAAGRLVASHCLVSGLGHAWSGGGAGQANSDPGGPDASRMVWAFVARQFSALHSNAIITIAN